MKEGAKGRVARYTKALNISKDLGGKLDDCDKAFCDEVVKLLKDLVFEAEENKAAQRDR